MDTALAPAHTKCTACPAAYTKAEWDALPLLGIQADEEVSLELRNCACGSTLATETERKAA